MPQTLAMKTVNCTYPRCPEEAIAWYRWTDLDGSNFEKVCAAHAELIRRRVSIFDGRGQMYQGIAEGAGEGLEVMNKIKKAKKAQEEK